MLDENAHNSNAKEQEGDFSLVPAPCTSYANFINLMESLGRKL